MSRQVNLSQGLPYPLQVEYADYVAAVVHSNDGATMATGSGRPNLDSITSESIGWSVRLSVGI